MKEHRPDPQKLLKIIQEEERKEKKGKLKIYLGAAPGVGKTYAMLEDGITKREQGVDIVIGIVESHGRDEIESLLQHFEFIPQQKIQYHGHEVLEFDLDAALKRHPKLILVDEMAHNNIPGLRHSKRWQDIKELLDRGIDVYTTLNVQHIESLNDVVSQIIHTRIKETVPDSMIELADTIELIDLPQEDLLKRLEEGKIYIPKQAKIAIDHFFRKGNLSALRELALRITAERVSAEVLLYRQGLGIKHIWPTKEKLLVCIGSNTESNKLIRAARRMSTSLQAEWTAVFVNTIRTTDAEYRSAIDNLRFAEKLGADTKILTGEIVTEIIHFAREQNITKIILGKKKPSFWRQLFSQNITDKIINKSGEIDVYMVHEDPKKIKHIEQTKKSSIPFGIYSIAILIVCSATLINNSLFPYIRHSSIIMIYLLGAILVSLLGKRGPSLLATFLSILAYDYFFIPPYHQFIVTDIQYLFTILVILFITQIITSLMISFKRIEKAAHLAEKRTSVLHTLSRQLASTRGIDKLLYIAIRYLSDEFDCSVIALLSDDGELNIHSAYRTEKTLNEKEKSVARWVFDLGQAAGLGTDTLPFSEALFIPLLTPQETIGVLRIHPSNKNQLFAPEQMHLLEACANQIALAIEVDRLQAKSVQSELQIATDRVRSTILHSVAHDLRAPLISVMGNASTLIEMNNNSSIDQIKTIGSNIYNEIEQLNRLINNLLQITYLEADDILLEKHKVCLKDFIENIIHKSIKPLGSKTITIDIPSDLEVPLDSRLVQEVIINLIDNAIKFTPKDTPIEISAKTENNEVNICVADRGPGIMTDEINQLFDKFYRGRLLSSERGLGLGLAICRMIIKAHGGDIWAENREGGGAVFCIKLPLYT